MAFMTARVYGLLALYGALAVAGEALADPPPINGIEEVSHDRVQLNDGFWGPRQKTHLKVTIPHALDCLEADGHVTNFDVAAGVSNEPLRGHHAFDSDLHKALEGALISLKHHAIRPCAPAWTTSSAASWGSGGRWLFDLLLYRPEP